MSTHENKIIIGDPEAFRDTIQAMTGVDRGVGFANALSRLIDLFSGYLAEDTPATHKRTATLWANHRMQHDFFWTISEEPLQPSADPVEDRRFILVGGLHYHAFDRTWSINT